MSDDYEVTEVTVSAGVKKQLEQYEPINEQVTLTAEVSLASEDDVAAVVEDLEGTAYTLAERGVMNRYEEHVREQAFGDE